MPYIKRTVRMEIDEEIDVLIERIRSVVSNNPDIEHRDGLLNYIFTTILLRTYPKQSYHDFNEIIGLLECVKQEFYRRKVAPYEEEKAESNGDVY